MGCIFLLFPSVGLTEENKVKLKLESLTVFSVLLLANVPNLFFPSPIFHSTDFFFINGL